MATLINITGGGFSGTTLIDLALGNSPDAFSCGEVYAWFRPARTHHFRINCSCKDNPCPQWEKLKDLPEENFHARAFEELKVGYIVDSSKELSWFIDSNIWAMRHGIRVVNLVVWKDPMDHYFSYWKKGRGLFRWRRGYVRIYERIFSLGIPFVSVNFNEFAADPAGKLKDICRAVGMEYFPGKENFWEKRHHILFGNPGTRKMLMAGAKDNRIRSRVEYPPEFERRSVTVNKRFEKDAGLQMVVKRLKETEVSRLGEPLPPVSTAGPRSAQPWWYYKDMLVRRYKRAFPQPWPEEE